MLSLKVLIFRALVSFIIMMYRKDEIMRTKTVTVNGKTVIINEKKISELKALYEGSKDEFDGLAKANTVDNAENSLFEILYKEAVELFPVLNQDDIDNAYPSELEELIGGFIDVNFFGVKKIGAPLLKIVLQGLKKA